MNDAFEAIGIALAVAMVLGIPFGFFAFMRYLRFKETIALAERGLLRPARAKRNRDTLRWGIVITTMGTGLMCGLYPLGFSIDPGMASQAPLGFGPWMLFGILPFFFGLSLLIIYYVNKREDLRYDAEEPDPIPPHKVNGE
ncbi:MAG: hypothetical protein DWQ04_23745 [Chloroflexi bacterium]|nr:MAG: hypothetical protein DWQ04_23745 [Chloroflexota bacterium]